METFRLLGRGLTTEEIAEKMHVNPKTVETCRLRIKEKLGMEKVSELVQRAAQTVLEKRVNDNKRSRGTPSWPTFLQACLLGKAT